MADPISALQLAVSAVKTAVAIAAWMERRNASRDPQEDAPSGTKAWRQTQEDILFVLATLGQRILALEVVNHAALPEARKAVRAAFTFADEDDMLGEALDKLDDVLQYSITCAMVFCSQCYPMHIYRGFGCGVMNYMMWADPENSNVVCEETDTAIGYLKSVPHQWQLLTKSAIRISREDPFYDARPKDVQKVMKTIMKDEVKEFEKRGFPQPLPPNDYIKITTWSIPFATWAGKVMYEEHYHNYEPLCAYQQDPGRFFYAWTAGQRADLQPGEAILLTEPHIIALAEWLEGLRGMTFKVLKDSDLDHSKLKYSSSTKKTLKKQLGNEFGITNEGMVIVRETRPRNDVNAVSGQFQKMDIGSPKVTVAQVDPPAVITPPTSPLEIPSSPPAYYIATASGTIYPATESGTIYQIPESSSIPQSPPKPAIRRRPVPTPPQAVLRVVRAAHDFTPETEEELGFSKGDRIEILDDKLEDPGWWKARIGGKIGVVPGPYME